MTFGVCFSLTGSETIRYGLTLGLHWAGTFPITHRWYTTLPDGENGSCLLHLLRVASFDAFLVAALCSRIAAWVVRVDSHALARHTRTHGIASLLQ
jgi:hypothetical protein